MRSATNAALGSIGSMNAPSACRPGNEPERTTDLFGPPPVWPTAEELKIHKAVREFSEGTTGEHEVSDGLGELRNRQRRG